MWFEICIVWFVLINVFCFIINQTNNSPDYVFFYIFHMYLIIFN